MEVALNTFTKLNQDFAYTHNKEGTYFSGSNVRPTTSDGQSTGALTNIRGNSFFIEIPDTSDVYTITIPLGNAFPYTCNFGTDVEINGITYNTGAITATSTEDLAQQISDGLNANPTFITDGFVATYYNNKITIHNITGITFTSFNVTDVCVFITYETELTVPAQTNLSIIGWGLIRDSIYLLTTNSIDLNPGGVDITLPIDPSSTGQVWRVTYDKKQPLDNTLTSITLIYNNYLNLSKEHPVANPGMIEGRYENNIIQGLYWTDNFNKLRKLNVADPNAFSFPLETLAANSVINYSIPVLQLIGNSGGNTPEGEYQAAYRYYNQNGLQTKFSLLSNLVHIVEADENGNYKDYDGHNTASTTSKTITWRVDNLDNNFDFIEYVVIYKQNKNSTPVIKSVYKTSFDTFSEFTFGGFSDNDVELTIDEFTYNNGTFDVCGTIAQKNNILFVSNVKSNTDNIRYDARAFRYKPNQTTYATSTADDPDSTNNDINPYNTDIDYSTNDYKFQSDGITFGGSGVNISYKFITKEFVTDVTNAPVTVPYYSTNKGSSDILNGIGYTNTSFTDFKSPYIDDLFKGYKRNEIYRFGIVFFDKAGNPGFVKWIGDIRIPDMYEDAGPIPYYPIITDNGTYVTSTQIGINFTVNIPTALSKLIGGFSIVRCERTDQDKTILGQGLTFPMVEHSAGSGEGYMGYETTDYTYHAELGENYNPLYAFYQSPEFIFNGYNYNTSDKFHLICELNTKVSVEPKTQQRYKKMYTPDNWNVMNASQNFNVENGASIGLDIHNDVTKVTLLGTYSVHNTVESGGAGKSNGNNVVALQFDANITNNTSGKLIIADYYRPNTNQYGGNTFFGRSNSKYISTGHFSQVNSSDLDTIYVVDVFGGDTYTHLFDVVRGFKWFTDTGGAGASLLYGTAFIIPVETSINTVLRKGHYLNNKGYLDGASPYDGVDSQEDFIYNSAFSSENNINYYFSKPFNFLNYPQQIYDTRTYASEVKYNGELTDSWTIFKSNNFIDVEGSYGKITLLLRHRDKLLFLQDRAIGLHSVNDRSIITDDNQAALTLGTGGVLQRYDYISTNIGCIHRFGVTLTDTSVYWYDVHNNRQYKLSEGLEPINDINGLTAFFTNNILKNIREGDNPYLNKGITSTYDYLFNEVNFTFKDNYTVDIINETFYKDVTICYNEIIKGYTSFYDFKPSVYVNDKWNLFSTNEDNTKLYIHNYGNYGEFYDVKYPSKVSFIVNESPLTTKMFVNQVLNMEVTNGNNINFFGYINEDEHNITNVSIVNKSFDSVRYYNTTQNTDFQDLTTIAKRKERDWNIVIPRNRVLYISPSLNIFDANNLSTPNNIPFGEKLRSKYIMTDLIFNNTDNNEKFTLYNVNTLFEISPR